MRQQFSLSSELRAKFLTLFSLIVFSAITLPMLPVWQGALRLLACVVMVSLLPQMSIRKPVLAILALSLTFAVVVWIQSFVKAPANHVIHALTDIYGQPIGPLTDGTILLVDLVCIFGLGYVVLARRDRYDRMVMAFTGCLMFFWAWSLLGILDDLTYGIEPSLLAQMLTGVSVWATWIYFALLAIVLIRGEDEIREIIGWIGMGGFVVAIVIAMQWILGDYSYVLDAPRFDDYFYRVRGTYYYHTSATYALVLCSLVILSLAANRSSQASWLLVVVAFMVAMVLLNNTRALSLTFFAGLVVTAAAAIRQRNFPILALALIGGVLIFSNIFYVKPNSGSTLTVGATDAMQGAETLNSVPQTRDSTGRLVTGSDTVDYDVGELVRSNQSRSVLLHSSIDMLGPMIWFGSGIGVLEIPLEGNGFNGLQSTYSSHTLYLDILLMAGAPALMAAIAAFGLAAWRCSAAALVNFNRSNSYRANPILAALAMFAIASLFIPQERNELTGVAFLLASLAILRPDFTPESVRKTFPRIKKLYVGSILAGVAGWVFLTSPAYVFPVIELIARHGTEIRQNKSSLVVTEPLMKPVAEFFLRLRGINDPDVSILTDAVENLPQENTWMLWSPKNDSAYAGLRENLGYQEYRQGGHAPSIRLPQNWWIMPSSQPLVIFAYAGSRQVVTLPFAEIAIVRGAAESIAGIGTGTYSSGHFESSGNSMYWSYKLRLDAPPEFGVTVVSYPDGDYLGKAKFVDNAADSAADGVIAFDSSKLEQGVELELHASIRTMPNLATGISVTVPENHLGIDRSIADHNFGSAVYWPSNQTATVMVRLNSPPRSPLGVYRMVAFNLRGVDYSGTYSWTVEASEEGRIWSLVDHRNEVVLSRNPEKPSAFFLLNRGLFQYYRFQFGSSETGGDTFSGLMELELYPMPEQLRTQY